MTTRAGAPAGKSELTSVKTGGGSGAATEQARQNVAERNIRAVADLERAALSQRTPLDRIIDTITDFCGSMSFVYVHAIWFGGWLLWNLLPLIPKGMHFDPYPFQLLTLVVSLEAIFLSTFILISQNRQSRLSERRNHLDLQINLLAEQETTKMLGLLEAIAQRLDIDCDDPELAEMVEETQPERIVEEIEELIEKPQSHNGHRPEEKRH